MGLPCWHDANPLQPLVYPHLPAACVAYLQVDVVSEDGQKEVLALRFRAAAKRLAVE